MCRLEPGLRGQDAVVELPAPTRHAGLDPATLELVGVERRLELRVEHLDGTGKVGPDPVSAKHERRRVLLGLDLALRAQPHAHEQRANLLAELRLGEKQEVLVTTAPHDDRCDQARLRGQQQCRARLADL